MMDHYKRATGIMRGWADWKTAHVEWPPEHKQYGPDQFALTRADKGPGAEGKTSVSPGKIQS